MLVEEVGEPPEVGEQANPTARGSAANDVVANGWTCGRCADRGASPVPVIISGTARQPCPPPTILGACAARSPSLSSWPASCLPEVVSPSPSAPRRPSHGWTRPPHARRPRRRRRPSPPRAPPSSPPPPSPPPPSRRRRSGMRTAAPHSGSGAPRAPPAASAPAACRNHSNGNHSNSNRSGSDRSPEPCGPSRPGPRRRVPATATQPRSGPATGRRGRVLPGRGRPTTCAPCAAGPIRLPRPRERLPSATPMYGELTPAPTRGQALGV